MATVIDARRELQVQGRRSLAILYAVTTTALVAGSLAAVFVAAGTEGGTAGDGLRWALYMVSVAWVGAILGLIFAIPRARPDYIAEPSERYLANSNLEQISDWLTKLLVGAGLVELTNVPGGLRSLGDYLGEGMGVPNSSAFAVSAVVYGTGLGFAAGYLWTRLRLRLLLETSDRNAAEASRKRDEIVRHLSEAASAPGGLDEKPSSLRLAAESALTIVTSSEESRRRPVLWVDDHPENNISIVRALQGLNIAVDTVLSTNEALDHVQRANYGLIITDLGRKEGGTEHPMAGRELIEQLRQRGDATPVIVFAGSRGKENERELKAAGAYLVTQRASEVFEEAVRICAGA